MKRYALRGDLTIVEQSYRGEQSFIVKERATHKYFRFKLLEILVMQQLDGTQTCPEVAAALAEQGLPVKAAAVEAFARRLDGMGLLEKTLAERSVLQLERLRAERNRRVRRTHYRGSLLRMRWSVGDPNALLDRWIPHLGFFFSKPFVAISIGLFVTYFAIVIGRADAFAAGLSRMYTPSSWSLEFIVLFWCTAVTVIAIHEFGHGFCCKHFGGEVHEMGAMLIYGTPAFYCNVNDAWTFPDRAARMWVTAAGSWIQMVVAGLAAIVWWAVEPGTVVSQVALIAVLIGGVMTVVANANPLIPLDGYYAVSDWLEIPNLRARALGYVAFLIRRHVLRLTVPEPPLDERERRIFLVYGFLAFAYSATILTTLAAAVFGWVRGTLGAIGALLFLLVVWSALGRHVRGWSVAVVTALREHRAFWSSRPVWRRGAALAALLIAAGMWLPTSIRVHGRFVAATPVDVVLVAPADAVIWRVAAGEGDRVEAGQPVLVLRSVELERAAIARGFAAESLAARAQRALASGTVDEARRLGSAAAAARAELAGLRERIAQLTLRAPVAGIVTTRRLVERTGARAEAGDSLARLSGAPDTVELRIALERAGATLVRAGQAAAVFPYSDPRAASRGRIASVAAAGAPPDANGSELEARVRIAGGAAWRPGVTGEAQVVVRRSNVFGAVWWALRKRVRSDLLL